MRKRIVLILAASLLLLTACAAPAEDTPEEPEEGAGPAVETVPPVSPEPRNMLPGMDVSGLEASMPEADFAAFQAYLPVLIGEETFCWVAGPSYDDWEEAWSPLTPTWRRSMTGTGAMMRRKTRRDADPGPAGSGGHRGR